MTAQLLREAAALMREHSTVRAEHGDDEAKFRLAVADWLDAVADRAQQTPKSWRGAKEAARVARAYLGTAP